MTSDWPEVSLEEVADDVTVGHVGPMADEYVPTGIPFLRSLNVEPYRINTVDLKYIGQGFHTKLRKSSLVPGDVVIVRTGKPGSCAVIPDWLLEANCSDLVIVRCGARLRPRYLSYVINFVALHHVSAHLVGAVQQHFNVGSARTLRFKLPPVRQQDYIISILDRIDSRIALNQRISETLDAMARAIFKDWFVDFGPTLAKMEEREPYLAPEIWSLFPDQLDDEGKPEGWATGSLADIASLNPESWARVNYPQQVEYVDLSNTKWGTIESTELHTRETAPSRAQRVLRVGDTIVGTVRPGNGSYAYVAQGGLTGSTGFAVLRPQRLECREMCYLAATSPENIERLSHLADGAAYPAVRPEVVAATGILGFTDEVIGTFSRILLPLIGRIEENKRESRSLAQMRDLLLPKLMSGDIRVRDAEKAVAELV